MIWFDEISKIFSNFQYQLSNNIDEDHLKITSLGHVDHENVHTFEIKDLQKLISKVSEDLSAADKARREEFKVRKFFISFIMSLLQRSFSAI